jgi:hypothetical protein
MEAVADDLELAGHRKEESSPSPSHLHARRHPPSPRGQKSPTWGEVAGTDRKGARPPLGSVSTGIRQSRAPTIGNPRLEAKKRPCEGEMRGSESPPIPSPPHQKTQT